MLLEGVSGALEAATVDESSTSAGAEIGKGVLRGLEKFISGPGAVLAGIVVVRLLSTFGKFAKDITNSFIFGNTQASKQLKLQAGITQWLQKQPGIMKQVAAGELTANGLAQLRLSLLRAETKELASIEALS